MDFCTESAVGYWVRVLPWSLNSNSTNQHSWSVSDTILISILCALSHVMPTTTQNFWSNHTSSLCHRQDLNPSILPQKPVFLTIPYATINPSSTLGKSHFLNLGFLNDEDSYTLSVSGSLLSPLQMFILSSSQQSCEVAGAHLLDQVTQLVNSRVRIWMLFCLPAVTCAFFPSIFLKLGMCRSPWISPQTARGSCTLVREILCKVSHQGGPECKCDLSSQ